MKIKLLKFCAGGYFMIAALGCAEKIPEKSTFELQMPSLPKLEGLKKKQVQLLIATPNALKNLDNQDIIIKAGEGSIAALNNAQWNDRLPELIQMRLIQLVNDTKILRGAAKRGEDISANYILWLDIHDFEIEIMNTLKQTAYINISAKLVDERTGIILANQTFRNRIPLKATHNIDYIKSLNLAFNYLAQSLVQWLIKSIPGT